MDGLQIDISKDLSRIDGAMTKVITDSQLSSEFLKDPNGVMVRVGTRPPT